MSYSRRQRQEEYEYRSNTDQQQQQQRQQHEATNHSIDQTKDNIHRAVEEVRREIPRYSQTVTDFQNETADASAEIADTFLESQKEIINSMQSAWAPMAERIGQATNYWTTTTGMAHFFSPQEMANVYARTIGAISEAYVASTRMATNMMFAGLEATRATTNYARQNAKDASHITSNTARAFGQIAKETVQVQGEDQQLEGGARVGSSSFGARGKVGAAEGSTVGSFESRGGATAGAAEGSTVGSFESRGGAKTRTTYASEGTKATTSGIGSDTTTTTPKANTVSLSDTVPGITENNRKKF